MSDSEVLTIRDRLGDPEEIVEAQRPEAVLDPERPLREQDAWAEHAAFMDDGTSCSATSPVAEVRRARAARHQPSAAGAKLSIPGEPSGRMFIRMDME